MKKTAEKVALVAQICIAIIFVTVCVLALFGVIDLSNEGENGFAIVIMSVLAVVFLGLSGFMIYMHFSENAVLKQVLLYSYFDSTVKATARVVKRTAVQSSRLVEGVKLKSVQIRPDDKFGLKMRVVISIKSENAEHCTDMLRVVLADGFKTVLGLKFSAIDFKIVSMKTDFTPDLEKAKESVKKIEAERAIQAELDSVTHINTDDIDTDKNPAVLKDNAITDLVETE